MLRPISLICFLLAVAACGSARAPSGGTGGFGTGGTGGSLGDPCADVQVKIGGIGDAFAELHEGDKVNWEWGLQGCCHVWTGLLAKGFPDDDQVLYEFQVSLPDGTDWSLHDKFCSRFGDLDQVDGWRAQTCQKDRMDSTALGLPMEGPVKLKVAIRNGVAYNPDDPDPCKPLDVRHCEASAEVNVDALAPPDHKTTSFCLAPPP